MSDRKSPEWVEAFRAYIASRWSLYHLEVLSHHFCSHAPFPREHAPAYPGCLAELRDAGLIDTDRQVTTRGVLFIARLCNTSCDALPSGADHG